MSGENYRSASKSHEPGWNDPPKVAHADHTTVASSGSGPNTKTSLNKRVAFPLQHRTPLGAMQAGQIDKGQSVPLSSPPTSTRTSAIVHPPAGPPSTGSPARGSGGPKEETQPDKDEPFADREAALRQVKATFNGSIQRMEESRRDEMQKRINRLYESWTDGKLPEGLERHIYHLASALLEKDAVRASGIHRSIICDYSSNCALWAPALRQLIFALPQRNDEPNVAEAVVKSI